MPLPAIRRFIESETAGGLCLMVAAVLAMVCANMPGLSPIYHATTNPLVMVIVNDGLHWAAC
jgi:Na+/H+ antiporter NhaA